MSSMLTDAIVDAKALKEAAMKTAEESLMEKYAPQIQEAVMTILEQDEEELDPMMMGDMGPDMGSGEVSGMVNDVPLGATEGEKLCSCPDEEEEIEINFSELEKQLAQEEEAEDMGHEDLAQDLLGVEPDMEPGMDDEDELDLTEDEIREAIKDAVSLKEIDLEEASCGSGKRNEDEKLEENVFDTDVNKVAAKKREEKDLKESKKVSSDKKLLSEVSKKQKENERLIKENQKLSANFNKLTEETGKLKSVLLETAEDLKMSNLSNAKLYYENQVLKSVSLNERQKEKIVEAVSNAGSVEEAKTLYEMLKDSMGSGHSSIRREPKSLSEAVQKKSILHVSAKRQNSNAANDGLANRWQKMAGIKK